MLKLSHSTLCLSIITQVLQCPTDIVADWLKLIAMRNDRRLLSMVIISLVLGMFRHILDTTIVINVTLFIIVAILHNLTSCMERHFPHGYCGMYVNWIGRNNM